MNNIVWPSRRRALPVDLSTSSRSVEEPGYYVELSLYHERLAIGVSERRVLSNVP